MRLVTNMQCPSLLHVVPGPCSLYEDGKMLQKSQMSAQSVGIPLVRPLGWDNPLNLL
jgi:hypothetical protein